MTTQSKQPMLFVNLSVRDLPASMAFFSKLGFDYNRKFCDDNAACMIVSDQACVMLLQEPFFKSFTKRDICDRGTHTEGLFAISRHSREAVDELVDTAMTGGASEAMPATDHGFMYIRTFYDLDGHHWEIFWMDESQMPS